MRADSPIRPAVVVESGNKNRKDPEISSEKNCREKNRSHKPARGDIHSPEVDGQDVWKPRGVRRQNRRNHRWWNAGQGLCTDNVACPETENYPQPRSQRERRIDEPPGPANWRKCWHLYPKPRCSHHAPPTDFWRDADVWSLVREKCTPIHWSFRSRTDLLQADVQPLG